MLIQANGKTFFANLFYLTLVSGKIGLVIFLNRPAFAVRRNRRELVSAGGLPGHVRQALNLELISVGAGCPRPE